MKRLLSVHGLLLFGVTTIGLAGTGGAKAADVAQAYVQSAEIGQAFLLGRLGECYAVTPAHVVGEDYFASLVGGTPGSPIGDADLLQTFGYDLSILRTTGAVSRQCGGSFGNSPNLDQLLGAVSAGVVTSVNGDGSISRRNITFTDVSLTHLRVRPVTADDQLFKGLSGSLVFNGEQPVGILMSVDPETGEGRVLRYDRALETLRPFFGLSPAPVPSAETTSSTTAPAAANIEGRVISWSNAPLGAQHRTANLIDGKGPETVWLTRPDNFPVELVFALPGEQVHELSALRLVGEGVEPKERLPRDIEILVRSHESSGWLPVNSGTYFKNDPEKLIRFAPVRARQVMLRIYSHWGDGEALGLSAVELPGLR